MLNISERLRNKVNKGKTQYSNEQKYYLSLFYHLKFKTKLILNLLNLLMVQKKVKL